MDGQIVTDAVVKINGSDLVYMDNPMEPETSGYVGMVQASRWALGVGMLLFVARAWLLNITEKFIPVTILFTQNMTWVTLRIYH